MKSAARYDKEDGTDKDMYSGEGENDCFTALGWTPEGREGDQIPLGEGLLRWRETRQGGRVGM